MSNTIRNTRKNDDALSPVIGTILMVAATVIIGATVYAAVNTYGGKQPDAATDAAFKATSLDSDGNGVDDTLKVTYLTGPSAVPNSQVSVSARDSANFTMTKIINSRATQGQWNPGDYETYKLNAAGQTGAVFVTVRMLENTILDTSAKLGQKI